MSTALDLSKKLSDLYDKQAALSKELEASFAIQAVWPEAFDGGCSCKLIARETIRTMQQAREDRKRGKIPELKECYLLRSDGVRFDLPAEVYWTLREMRRGKSNDDV